MLRFFRPPRNEFVTTARVSQSRPPGRDNRLIQHALPCLAEPETLGTSLGFMIGLNGQIWNTASAWSTTTPEERLLPDRTRPAERRPRTLSNRLSLGLRCWRLNTRSCCRNARFSRTRLRRVEKRRVMVPRTSINHGLILSILRSSIPRYRTLNSLLRPFLRWSAGLGRSSSAN